MPGAPSIDPVKKTTALALGDMGYKGTKIAKMLGMAQRTVYDILGGDRNYLSGPVDATLRTKIKERLQARSLDLSDRCLDQIELTLPETHARDAAVTYGILRDHERVDAGEPTQLIGIAHLHEIPALDRLATVLAQRLLPANDVSEKTVDNISQQKQEDKT